MGSTSYVYWDAQDLNIENLEKSLDRMSKDNPTRIIVTVGMSTQELPMDTLAMMMKATDTLCAESIISFSATLVGNRHLGEFRLFCPIQMAIDMVEY